MHFYKDVKTKMKHTTNLAVLKYNEIIGFKDIDMAFEKISTLQVILG